MRTAVVIPVKTFTVAKGRLAGALTDNERESLARTCAEGVVAAAAPWPVFVVCTHDDVARWAESLGATVVRQHSPGLNGAVRDGRAAAHAAGCDHVLVAHSDLPLAVSFAHVPVEGHVVLVPDRHDDGTNVMCLPADVDFEFRYGTGSFAAHLEESVARGIPHRVMRDDALSLDLDTADDLREFHRRKEGTQ